jgi:acid phosphatase family membrane protein YuiD
VLDINHLKYLIVIVAAWLIAHILKFILSYFYDVNRNNKDFFRSGGMPSAHSATIVSIAMLIGLVEGFGSAIFALAVAISLIVMHDAVRARRATGDNSIAIERLIKEQNSKVVKPQIVKGHTLPEVIVGAILGIIIGVVVFLATN